MIEAPDGQRSSRNEGDSSAVRRDGRLRKGLTLGIHVQLEKRALRLEPPATTRPTTPRLPARPPRASGGGAAAREAGPVARQQGRARRQEKQVPDRAWGEPPSLPAPQSGSRAVATFE